jgi:hypothetical protein
LFSTGSIWHERVLRITAHEQRRLEPHTVQDILCRGEPYAVAAVFERRCENFKRRIDEALQSLARGALDLRSCAAVDVADRAADDGVAPALVARELGMR